MRSNCWEYKGCGRERGGAMADELGVCAAFEETKLDGTHGGRNAGRACWAIAGTFCGGKVQGTFAEKEKTCLVCDFYKLVRQEEKDSFVMSATMLETLAA